MKNTANYNEKFMNKKEYRKARLSLFWQKLRQESGTRIKLAWQILTGKSVIAVTEDITVSMVSATEHYTPVQMLAGLLLSTEQLAHHVIDVIKVSEDDAIEAIGGGDRAIHLTKLIKQAYSDR